MDASRPRSWVVRSALSALWLVSLATVGSSATVGQPDSELAYPLEGTRWRLTEYVGAGQARPPGPEVDAWLRLGEGRLIGSTGCAKLRGSYVVGPEAIPVASDSRAAPPEPSAAVASPVPDGSAAFDLPADARLAFPEVTGGGRDCAEQTMLVVAGMRDGLARTAGSRLMPASPPWASTLDLFDETGAPVLRFRVDDVGSLAGATWLLETVNGRSVETGIDGQPAVLAFDAPSTARSTARSHDPGSGVEQRERLPLTGSTGCNGFSGRYVVTASVLTIGELTTTTDPCSPLISEQEVVMLGILGASSLRITLPPDALELRSDDDARVLRYRTAAPLEGQPWVLERNRAKRIGTAEAVTLFLVPDDPDSTADVRSGTITGEGPCRPYAGTYRTDGLLVELRPVVSEADPCAIRRPEQRYLRALRQAAFGEVDGGILHLRDDQGRELVAYATPGLP